MFSAIMISSIKDLLYSSEPFRKFAESVKESRNALRLEISGVNGSLMAFVADLLGEHFSNVILVVSTDDRAEQLRDDCALVTPGRKVNLYAHAEHHSRSLTARPARTRAKAARAG